MEGKEQEQTEEKAMNKEVESARGEERNEEQIQSGKEQEAELPICEDSLVRIMWFPLSLSRST